jgi:hypothetical protein
MEILHPFEQPAIHLLILLPAGETRESFVEQSAGGVGLRAVHFPGEDAVAAGPCADAAVWQCRAGGDCDAVIDHVHVADQEDFRAARGSVDGFLQKSVEHEFRVSGAGRDLPNDLDEEVAVESGEEALAVAAGCGRVLLCAYVEECHVDGVTDAELVFAE